IPTPEEIGRETTNDDGLFIIAFGTAPGSPEPAARNLRLPALDATGTETWSTDVHVSSDQRDVLEFRVPARRAAEPTTHALDQVVAATQIEVPPSLLEFLSGRNIRTLGDICRAGGLAGLAG